MDVKDGTATFPCQSERSKEGWQVRLALDGRGQSVSVCSHEGAIRSLAGSALLPTDEALASRKPRKRFPLSGTGIDRFAVFDSRGQQPPGNKSN